MWAQIKKFMNHERYQTISIFLVLILLIVAYGCESKVESIRTPGTRINRGELEIEINTILQEAELRADELNMKDDLKETLYRIGVTTAQSGTVNPIGVLSAIAGILGIGAITDNVRKRRDIKKWESGKLAPG